MASCSGSGRDLGLGHFCGSILRHKLPPHPPLRRGRTSADADVVVRLTNAVSFVPGFRRDNYSPAAGNPFSHEFQAARAAAASTISPQSSRSLVREMSPILRMPTKRLSWLITGRRRTLFCSMVRAASATSSVSLQ